MPVMHMPDFTHSPSMPQPLPGALHVVPVPAQVRTGRSASRGLAWLAVLSLGVLMAACTRTSEPTTPTASTPAANTGGELVVWADAGLKPLMTRAVAEFESRSQRKVAVQYGDSAQLRQQVQGHAGAAVQVYVGLATPLADSDVLVVHPGDVKPQQLGIGEADAKSGGSGWGRAQWLWQDRVCSLSRVPVQPGTVMGQWQRKGVVLAASFAGGNPVEPVQRVLVTAEGLQPGLREQLLGKLRQWHGQSTSKDALQAVQGNLAHMAIVPCAQARALGPLADGLQLTTLSPALEVDLRYGMAVRNQASDAARQFAEHLQASGTQAAAAQLGMGVVAR